ncbi:hypothetical protein ACWDA3_01405 [Nonomuraea rubra]
MVRWPYLADSPRTPAGRFPGGRRYGTWCSGASAERRMSRAARDATVDAWMEEV